MAEMGVCAQCEKPASQRCSRCKVLRLCSRECFRRIWPTHQRDCDTIKQYRDMCGLTGHEQPVSEAGESVLLPISPDEYIALFAPAVAARERHALTEQRLHAADPTLSTADKVRYYCDLLNAYDASSDEHKHKSLVQKMLLNRKYNMVHRDVGERLRYDEIVQLEREQTRFGIGEHFKRRRDMLTSPLV